MKAKRQTLLMGILLVLVLVYVAQQSWDKYSRERQAKIDSPPPLPGKNSISGLQVHQDDQGRWLVELDYFYTGNPIPVYLDLEWLVDADVQQKWPHAFGYVNRTLLKRGAQHVTVELKRPQISDALRTNGIVAKIYHPGPTGRQTLEDIQVSSSINWPDYESWAIEEKVAKSSSADVIKAAAELIDSNQLAEAKRILERVLAKESKADAAYLELARIAMSSTRGPEGFRQAEALISSALQIKPANPDSQILLGYVYAHQGRFKAAEELFSEASKANPRNLWLWSNWGELLAMQGKMDPALEMYRKAIDHPPTRDTNDRARIHAYSRMLVLFELKKNIDAQEALYIQREADYGAAGCNGAAYARFMLQQRGDVNKAIELAQTATQSKCTDEAARQVLGMAHYVAWASSPNSDKSELLNRARIYLPVGPNLFYQLATADRTFEAAKKLLAAGESIDQFDNKNFNALAYAMGNKNHDVARRLLKVRARPDIEVGPGAIPVALLPVLSNDLDGIRLMRQFGVDYAKMKFQGMTAIDHAKQTGNAELLEALGVKGKSS